jgi:hypothetical protein
MIFAAVVNGASGQGRAASLSRVAGQVKEYLGPERIGGLLRAAVLMAACAGRGRTVEPVYIRDSLSADGTCIFAEVEIQRAAPAGAEMVVAGGPNCSYRFLHVPGREGKPVVYAISFRYEMLDTQYVLKTSVDIAGWVTRARRHCFARRREVACRPNDPWERKLMAAHQLYTVNGTPAWVEDSDGNLSAPEIREVNGRRYVTVLPNGTVNISAKRPAL